MSRIIPMFSSAVGNTTTAADSAIADVQDENRITLAVDNATMDGCTLTVEVSYDQGSTWNPLKADGVTVALTDATERFMFECDGGLLRVNPSGAGASTSVVVYLVGDVCEHTAAA